jgi:hypothetical protein
LKDEIGDLGDLDAVCGGAESLFVELDSYGCFFGSATLVLPDHSVVSRPLDSEKYRTIVSQVSV